MFQFELFRSPHIFLSARTILEPWFNSINIFTVVTAFLCLDYNTFLSYSLDHKCISIVEVTDSDKHISLLLYGNNYGHKTLKIQGAGYTTGQHFLPGVCTVILFTAVIVAYGNKLECLLLPFTSTRVSYLQAMMELCGTTV